MRAEENRTAEMWNLMNSWSTFNKFCWSVELVVISCARFLVALLRDSLKKDSCVINCEIESVITGACLISEVTMFHSMFCSHKGEEAVGPR